MTAQNLTREELGTLEAYREIAKTRNNTHANPNYWEDEFVIFQSLLPRGKVVDIGCGAGRDAVLLREAGYNYTGFDLSPEMIEQAQMLVPYGQFEVRDLYQTGYKSQVFDGFWSACSLLHVPKAKMHYALREIQRITKIEGRGFIAMKEGEGESVSPDGRFYSYFHLDEFRSMLESNGFYVGYAYRNFNKVPTENTVYLCYLVAAV